MKSLCLFLLSPSLALAITNGVPSNELDTPSVVKLYLGDEVTERAGHCTGTFVSSRVAITAAHCFADNTASGMMERPYVAWSNVEDPDANMSKLSPQRVKVLPHPKYVTRQREVIAERDLPGGDLGLFDLVARETNPYDVALVVFGEDQSIPSLEIAAQAPKVGSEMALIGYGILGRDAVDADAALISRKRRGTNFYGGTHPGPELEAFYIAFLIFQELNVLAFRGYRRELKDPNIERGLFSIGKPGDSGGPVLIDGKIVGLLKSNAQLTKLVAEILSENAPSRIEVNPEFVDYIATSLTSAENMEFLKQADLEHSLGIFN